MRKLLGFACHVASVRLHEAAVWLLEPPGEFPPQVASNVFKSPAPEAEEWDDITLHDVAPRLSAAVDVVRRKLERMRTVALRRIGL